MPYNLDADNCRAGWRVKPGRAGTVSGNELDCACAATVCLTRALDDSEGRFSIQT